MALLALLAICALALGACGDDDEETPAGSNGGGEAAQSSESSEPAKVTVGVLPLAAVAPVYLGVEQGFFEEENLEVTPQTAQGGAALVPALQSGDMQFIYSNNVSPLLGISQGLEFRVVAEGNQEPMEEEEATEGIVVGADSPIKDAKDLEGKTMAVNTLQNIGTITMKTALEERGVDYDKIELIEVPFPDMLTALEEGRVDAVQVVEPFLGAAKANGARVLANTFSETGDVLGEPISIATYFTTKSYADENPDVVERFARALNKSTDYAAENPDEVRRIVQEYTELPPEVAENMTLPFFTSDLSEATFPFLAERMAKYGMVPEAPNIEGLLPEGS